MYFPDLVPVTYEWAERFFIAVKPKKTMGETALADEEIICAIGNSEGTRGDDCSPNPAYFGHADPGNGAHNMGTFSYQHGASSPEEADKKWLPVLRSAEADIQGQAIAKFGQPLSKAALLAAIDLYNQAPAAGNDFVQHLETHDPTPEQIINARAKSFVNPASGALEAPGLGNDPARVSADQERRVQELLEAIQ
jgi:hypothetical protein